MPISRSVAFDRSFVRWSTLMRNVSSCHSWAGGSLSAERRTPDSAASRTNSAVSTDAIEELSPLLFVSRAIRIESR